MADGAPRDIVEAFDRASDPRRRNRPLLVTADRTLRHGEVVERAERVAGLCAARGWKPGDAVALVSEDSVELTMLVLSLMRNGLAVHVFDPALSEREIGTLLELSQPVASFVDRERIGAWRLPGGPNPIEIAPTDRRTGALFRKLVGRAEAPDTDEARWPALLDTIEPEALPDSVDPESDAYVLFTSGTTALPKGVRISHRAVFSHLATLCRSFGYDDAARILNVLPLHHADGLTQGPVVAFSAGAMVHRPAPFRIPQLPLLLDAVYSERITHWVAVPALLAMVERLGSDFEESFTTDDFRFVICTADRLNEELWRRFESRFGTRVANVYGLTETVVGGLFALPDDDEPRIGTVGRPIDCEVRIVDEAGTPCPTGETGELELRGEHLMSGYLGSDDSPIRDGWLRTGDLAAIDAEGPVRIVGRRKNLVITGGINVQPEEVTEVLMGLAGVAEAVTFGVPDEILGERVIACVVFEPDVGLRVSDASAHARGHLAPEKRPSRIYALDSLPRGPSGKVRLDAVREQLERLRTAAGNADGSTQERVVALAADCFQLDPSEVGPGSRIADTPGWDSLGHLELVDAVETTFRVQLTTREILSIETLADVEKIVAGKLP